MGDKSRWQRIWHFLWHEDSVSSWIVSILLAFILIKYVLYPVLGLLMGTSFPVVAVVSDSMEHNLPFDQWWEQHEDLYLAHNVTKQDFRDFPMTSGFNKGDIIILVGTPPERIERGDIIVFWGGQTYPIIHRVVSIGMDGDGRFFQTKGDNNLGQIINPPFLDERHIPSDRPCEDGRCPVVMGRAILRIPYLGWVKILFVEMLGQLGIPIAQIP